MSKGNILVVDDTYINLQLLEAVLDDAGYDVRTSTGGEMALESIQVQRPDLIMLDIMMPAMDGYETCEKIKANPAFRDVPVIFLSAKSESEDKVKGFNAGAVDYLTKPFDIDEILVRIKTHLKLSFLQKELEQKVDMIDKYVITSSTNKEGIITDASEAFCTISGYSKEELIGKEHNILRHPDTRNTLYDEIWSTLNTGLTWKGEIKNRRKDGQDYWVEAIISPRFNSDKEIIGFTSVRQDISDKKRIELLSITDQLTGLYNRRHFNIMFELQLKQAIRHGLTLSFIMLDIDFFKQYNDTYGHQDGDHTLVHVASTIKEQLLRSEDLSFRLGGEEFGVLCETSSCESAEAIAQKIRMAVKALDIEHRSSKISKIVTISLGVVCIDFSKKEDYSLTTDILYKKADEALYRSKEQGRDLVTLVTL